MKRSATLAVSMLAVLIGSAHPSRAADVLAGGWSGTSVTDAWVVAAATFAVKAQETASAKAEAKSSLSLVEILSANQQVVAGMNYRLRLKVNADGTEREAVAVVWRRVSGEHALTSWTWK